MTLLQTNRLILSEITKEDKAFILKLLNSPGFIKNIGDRKVRTVEQAENYIENKFLKSYMTHGTGLYKVVLKENGQPIGTCGLVKREQLEGLDIGYAILPDYEGKGYTFEASKAILEFAKSTLKIDTLKAYTSEENKVSQRLLQKLGFEFKGIEMIEAFENQSAVYVLKF